MEKFDKLLEYGQSYWLDNLSREIINNGELKRRIEEEGLRGITSNPKIFYKAISEKDFYDEQIDSLTSEDKTTQEIYEALVVRDIQNACDLLKSVYEASDGQDGYVSLEVSPHLARDTEGTINEARHLFKAVDRPNCFIKIPGTSEGVPAIEQMLYEGININITLLFSISAYEAVAEAYINALERRISEGKSVDKIASVASFFLSRIDVLVNKKIHEMKPDMEDSKKILADNLLGQAAIASARIAYQRFKEIFKGERWLNLSERGAGVQRLLWASTSNKTEGYRDTRYVEPLIGKQTVNTMPGKTIEAFKDHGTVSPDTIESDVKEAYKVFQELERIGIHMDDITDQLVEEGIEKFNDPFDKLMNAIEEKMEVFSD